MDDPLHQELAKFGTPTEDAGVKVPILRVVNRSLHIQLMATRQQARCMRRAALMALVALLPGLGSWSATGADACLAVLAVVYAGLCVLCHLDVRAHQAILDALAWDGAYICRDPEQVDVECELRIAISSCRDLMERTLWWRARMLTAVTVFGCLSVAFMVAGVVVRVAERLP